MAPSAKSYNAKEIIKNVKPKLLIDGKWVDAKSGKTFATINPQDESEIVQIAEADKEDVELAVTAARKAFDEGPWPKKTGAERARILNKFADLLEANLEELAQLETLDNGKPLAVSRAADIPFCIKYFRYFAGWADKLTGKTIPLDMPAFGYTLHEPIGVVAAIVPWNFPALMLAWKLAPALACGNTVVAKVAEQTPLTALRFGELALEAGIPAGVFNVLPGYGETAGAALCSHPGVDKITFTGSTEVGRIVGAEAAKNIKPCTLELGGKSAAIVWKDVDVQDVAKQAHEALFFNMGQCCAAGSRTFVHEDIYDEFVEATTKLAQGRKVGCPWDEQFQSGPQVDADQFQKIMGYITAGKEAGAKLHCGGSRIGDKGFYVEPTVFSNVTDDMKIAQDEIFGPVQIVLKYKTLDEVLKRANANEYGLAAGIFAKDIDVINTLSRGLKSGTVWVNMYNAYDAAMPFGGYKMSGVGRDKGEYCLENYMQTKAVYQSLQQTAWL